MMHFHMYSKNAVSNKTLFLGSF